MKKIVEQLGIRHETNVPLGPLTWYGVGGTAAVVAHPSSAQQLAALASKCHEAGVRVYVLGAGANLLVSRNIDQGVVIRLDEPHFTQTNIAGNLVTAGGGADLPKLVLQTTKVGLAGLECLAGIPATVGGAVRMNAGGTYGEIGSSVKRVQVMDVSGHVYYRDRDDLRFTYRKSNIVAPFILEVEFDLTPDDPDDLMRRVKEIFLYKKNTQPLAEHSAGCAFKNPQPPRGDEQADNPHMSKSAGALIDQAGLKGHRIGGAVVSSRHANFIIAEQGCAAGDILALLEHIEHEVLDRFGVKLQREVVIWP